MSAETTEDTTAETSELEEVVERFQRRVVVDALNESAVAYWSRRAQQFEEAAPRQGDYRGQASAASTAARAARLSAVALACRQRAALTMPALWLPSESA